MEHLLKIVQMGIAPLRKTTIVFTLKVSKIGWNITKSDFVYSYCLDDCLGLALAIQDDTVFFFLGKWFIVVVRRFAPCPPSLATM